MTEKRKTSEKKNVAEKISPRDRILSQKDLQEILPFGKTKIQQLLNENQLPVVRVGKDYITTFDILQDWVREHIGSEIYY